MTTTPRTLSTDTALRLLADQQRRRVLRRLAEGNGTTTTDQLVETLTNATPSTDGETTRDRIEIALHHIHLPVLEEAGVIEFDSDRETIRYNSVDVVEELLQLC